MRTIGFVLVTLGLVGCGKGKVSDEAAAEFAYIGLDNAIEKALDLGLQGYNAASSANIDDQQGTGDLSGTMTVGGQVDQSSSDNKGLRLDLTLVDYSDVNTFGEGDDEEELVITYDTPEGEPAQLDLQLRNMPDGTFTGTLVGDFEMEGDLEGVVGMNLTFDGELQDDGSGGTSRVPGATAISGTASSPYGDYDVELTR